jgi:hypothetical protein
MAGSATIVSNKKVSQRYRCIVWAWTADASGAVSDVGQVTVPGGSIVGFWSVPGSDVTDAFDFTLAGVFPLDDGSNVAVSDLLGGVGVDLSNSTAGQCVQVDDVTPLQNNTIIAPVIANAGVSVSGTILLFIWEE